MAPDTATTEPAERAEPGKKKPGPAPRSDWQEKFLESYALLGIESQAARHANVSVDTVARERARSEEFAGRYSQARKEADGVIERVLHERATTGQPVRRTTTRTLPDGKVETTVVETTYMSTAALLALARARMPEKYGVKVAHTGPDGTGPVLVEERRVEEAVGEFTAEVVRLADRRAAADAAG